MSTGPHHVKIRIMMNIESITVPWTKNMSPVISWSALLPLSQRIFFAGWKADRDLGELIALREVGLTQRWGYWVIMGELSIKMMSINIFYQRTGTAHSFPQANSITELPSRRTLVVQIDKWSDHSADSRMMMIRLHLPAAFNDQITVEARKEPKGIARQNALKGQLTQATER